LVDSREFSRSCHARAYFMRTLRMTNQNYTVLSGIENWGGLDARNMTIQYRLVTDRRQTDRQIDRHLVTVHLAQTHHSRGKKISRYISNYTPCLKKVAHYI